MGKSIKCINDNSIITPANVNRMIYAMFPFVKSPISQILSNGVIAHCLPMARSFDVFYRDVAILMGSLRKPALGGREDSTFLIPCECLKFNHEGFVRLFEAGVIAFLFRWNLTQNKIYKISFPVLLAQ